MAALAARKENEKTLLTLDDPHHDFMDFVRKSLQHQDPEFFWWYIAFEWRVRHDGGDAGDFACAVIVQASTWMKALDAAFDLKLRDSWKYRDCIQLPEDRIPAAEYRGRHLTAEAVQEFWPDAFAN
jgi:hypothetical protein